MWQFRRSIAGQVVSNVCRLAEMAGRSIGLKSVLISSRPEGENIPLLGGSELVKMHP